VADIDLTSIRNLWYNGVTYWVGFDGIGISCCKESRTGVLLPFFDGTFYSTVATAGYDVECGFVKDARSDLYVDVSIDGEGGFDRYKSEDLGYTWVKVIIGA
jgi:hypothetical protein